MALTTKISVCGDRVVQAMKTLASEQHSHTTLTELLSAGKTAAGLTPRPKMTCPVLSAGMEEERKALQDQCGRLFTKLMAKNHKANVDEQVKMIKALEVEVKTAFEGNTIMPADQKTELLEAWRIETMTATMSVEWIMVAKQAVKREQSRKRVEYEENMSDVSPAMM